MVQETRLLQIKTPPEYLTGKSLNFSFVYCIFKFKFSTFSTWYIDFFCCYLEFFSNISTMKSKNNVLIPDGGYWNNSSSVYMIQHMPSFRGPRWTKHWSASATQPSLSIIPRKSTCSQKQTFIAGQCSLSFQPASYKSSITSEQFAERNDTQERGLTSKNTTRRWGLGRKNWFIFIYSCCKNCSNIIFETLSTYCLAKAKAWGQLHTNMITAYQTHFLNLLNCHKVDNYKKSSEHLTSFCWHNFSSQQNIRHQFK